MKLKLMKGHECLAEWEVPFVQTTLKFIDNRMGTLYGIKLVCKDSIESVAFRTIDDIIDTLHTVENDIEKHIIRYMSQESVAIDYNRVSEEIEICINEPYCFVIRMSNN